MAGAALATSASAQDGVEHGWTNVDATVNWSKDVVVEENVSREKAVFIKATPVLRGAGGGEASAVATVGNAEGAAVMASGASVRIDGDIVIIINELGGGTVRSDATIKASVNFNSGIMQVNQDTGLMSNQGNLLSTASSEVFGTGSNLGDAQVEIEQYNDTNAIVRLCDLGACELGTTVEGTYGKFGTVRTSALQGAVNANIGIVNVNQNSGELNNQTNGNAVGIGADGAVMLGEAALGQKTNGNVVLTNQNYAASTIVDSINGNVAQVSVNQSSGGGNNQSSSFHFSSWLSFSTPGVNATKY